MIDYYLTFESEEEADTVLAETAEGYTVDILGFTEQFPTQYLVNIRGVETDVWDDYKATPEPQIPLRVFA